MALTPLLPERHSQRDFFIPEMFDNLPVKDDMASMENPLFTLSTKPDKRILEFSNGKKSVKVVPSVLGLPSIFDKDVLLYCGSQVMERVNKGEIPPKTLRISVHDFLIATNRGINGNAYDRFENSLLRLAGCVVETNIKTGNTEEKKGFGLIADYAFLKNEHAKRRIIGVEITLSDWFYNSLIAKEVLTIDRDYFRLRKPIERRVYEIARKHCGNKISWDIALNTLYVKSGALSDIKHFRAAVKKLAEHDHLPEYHVSYSRENDMVTFGKRGAVADAIANDSQPDFFSDTSTADAIPHQIHPTLLDDVRNVVGVGADYYVLWAEFRDYNIKKGAQLDSVRGSFIGFCKMKTGKAMRA